MAADAFTKRWIIALSCLVALGFAFPFIIGPITYATGCQSVGGGACGAVALMLGVFLRLPAVFGVGLYLSRLAWERSATAQIRPWGFPFVVMSYLASISVLFGFGNFWAANFTLGVRTPGGLLALGFLIAALTGLSLLPNPVVVAPQAKPRSTTFAVGGLSMLLLLPGALGGLTVVPFLNRLVFPVRLALVELTAPFLRYVDPYLTFPMLLAFVASLAWWIESSKASREDII